MANAFQIAEEVVGQTIDMDGAFGGQCVDIVQYVAQKYGTNLWGNGNQIGIANDVSAYADVIPWTDGFQMQVGDILSLDDNPAVNPYGHVLIYGGGSWDNALVIEQNYNWVQVVVKHRRSLSPQIPLRVVRFRGQDNYTPTGSDGATNGNPSKESAKKTSKTFTMYEITCDKVEGVRGQGDSTVLDIFFKCNRVTGKINGDWLIYDKNDGTVGYIPKSCVKQLDNLTDKDVLTTGGGQEVNPYERFSDVTDDGIDQQDTQKIYSLGQLINLGTVPYGGNDWGYLFQGELPQKNGFSLNPHGFIVDKDGYIVVSVPMAYKNSRGKIVKTPFGKKGKIYFNLEDILNYIVYVR